jgi:hypothetical protein
MHRTESDTSTPGDVTPCTCRPPRAARAANAQRPGQRHVPQMSVFARACLHVIREATISDSKLFDVLEDLAQFELENG